MGWRTVVITRRAKLDLQLGSLVVRNENVIKINIDEISVLLIECTAVSLTAALLAELTRKKVKVIFCDEKRLPSSELVPCYGSHDTSLKYKRQALWQTEMKERIWTEIIRKKISQQALFLRHKGKKEARLLEQYLTEIAPGDSSNREGHAAKVYFNALFGMNFSRTQDNVLNAALNYGYGLVLSAINREIAAAGTGATIADSRVSPEALAGLVEIVEAGTISKQQSKEVFAEMWTSGKSAADIVREVMEEAEPILRRAQTWVE